MTVVEGIMDKKLPVASNSDEKIDVVTDVLACTVQEGATDHSNRSESQESVGSGSGPSTESSYSSSSLGTASMDAESVGIIQSPEHKRQRSSRKKKPLSDSIRRHLDNQRFSQIQHINQHSTSNSESSPAASHASPSLPPTPTTPDTTDDEMLLTPRSPTPPPDATDPESQYKKKIPSS